MQIILMLVCIVLERVSSSAGLTGSTGAVCKAQCGGGIKSERRSCIEKCIKCIHCQSAVIQPYLVYPQIMPQQYQFVQPCQSCSNNFYPQQQQQPQQSMISSQQLGQQQQFGQSGDAFTQSGGILTQPGGALTQPLATQTIIQPPPPITPTNSMSQSTISLNNPTTPSAINSDLNINTQLMINQLEQKQRKIKTKLKSKNKKRKRKNKKSSKKKKKQKNRRKNSGKKKQQNKKLSEKLKSKGKKLLKEETLQQDKQKQFENENAKWSAAQRKAKKVAFQRIDKTMKKINKQKAKTKQGNTPVERPQAADMPAKQIPVRCPCVKCPCAG